MTELKAMILVGIGTVLLSVVLDIVLLLMHAGGTALSVALVLALCVGGVGMAFVMGRDESSERPDSEPKLN